MLCLILSIIGQSSLKVKSIKNRVHCFILWVESTAATNNIYCAIQAVSGQSDQTASFKNAQSFSIAVEEVL